MKKIHCVNVIEARRSGTRKQAVRMVLVLAENEEEAMKRVAQDTHHDSDRLLYRNVFDENETFTWGHQRWDREDVEKKADLMVPPRALASYNPEGGDMHASSQLFGVSGGKLNED